MSHFHKIKDALATLLDVDLKLKTGGYTDADAMTVMIAEVMEHKVS